METLKIKIRITQNVGKVWITPVVGKDPPVPICRHFMQFADGPETSKICIFFLPVFLGGPMGPIYPVWALAAIHPRFGKRVLTG